MLIRLGLRRHLGDTILSYTAFARTQPCRSKHITTNNFNARIQQPPLSKVGPVHIRRRFAYRCILRSDPAPGCRGYHSTRVLAASTIGTEPGVNVSDTDAAHSHNPEHKDTIIKVVDYSRDRLEVNEPADSKLGAFLSDQPKPDWSSCRWIHVNSLDSTTISCLGQHMDLHPLAQEDALDRHTPIKVDWYGAHCYIQMKLAKLVMMQSHSKEATIQRSPHQTLLQGPSINLGRRHRRNQAQGDKIAIAWAQVAVFLTSDGTVITAFEHSGEEVFEPVMARLESPKTVLRYSDDPSMLLQAIIDTVVDLSLPIGEAVAESFDELERAVLHNPTIPQSKQLHVLRSGLTLLLNNTVAMNGLVNTLCDHRPVSEMPSSLKGRPVDSMDSQSSSDVPIQISPTARIYLQDVQDHIQTLSNSTRMSIRSVEALSSLIFNSIAASQNESVRTLTLVSSFFLPLTFLTSYFGMNFDPMPSVNEHSEVFFWIIAAPVALSTLVLLLSSIRIRRGLR